MLQILLAIFITFILIKIAHKFDQIASGIEIIPLVFLPGLFAIVYSFIMIGMELPGYFSLLTLPAIFLISLVRLRTFEQLPWNRCLFYASIVVLSFIISSVIFQFLFF